MLEFYPVASAIAPLCPLSRIRVSCDEPRYDQNLRDDDRNGKTVVLGSIKPSLGKEMVDNRLSTNLYILLERRWYALYCEVSALCWSMEACVHI